MECLYSPEFDKTMEAVPLDSDERRHLRALRLRPGDRVMVTNGRGLIAECRIEAGGADPVPLVFLPEYGESKNPPSLALGLLAARDRYEFALEKAVEFGAADFYPLITQFTQAKAIKPGRLQAKAIAAMKQCKRSRLINIHKAMKLDELIDEFQKYPTVAVADPDGMDFTDIYIPGRILAVVGPEGGFSEAELEMLRDSNAQFLRLGNRRLRAESAAIGAMALISLQK